MNILRAIFLRDIAIEMRYRFNLAAKALNSIFYLTVFYFVAALVPTGTFAPNGAVAQQGGYFPFVFAGLAFSRFFAVCVGAGAEMIRQEQYWGTAENLFLSPVKPALIAVSGIVSRLLLAVLELMLMGLAGVLVFGVKLSAISILIVPLALIHGMMFAGIGLLSAGFIMRFKRGDPAGWLLGIAVDLASGVYFPVMLLPRPIAIAAAQLPTTTALNIWRMILLEGVFPPAILLAGQCFWAVALFWCGWLVFGILFDSARRNAAVGNY